MVESIHNYSSLRLVLNHGEDENGKEILKSKTFANVKKDATDTAVYEVADAFTGLQEHLLMNVERINSLSLIKA